MEVYSTLFFLTAFAGGVISFFSPCTLPLLPVYMGVLVEDTGEYSWSLGNYRIYPKPILKTTAFILGLSTVFFLLGYGAGALGGAIRSPYTNYIMGGIVILLGLHQMEWIHFKGLQKQFGVDFNKKNREGYLGAYLLGLTFSFGWTPCIGPVLGSILAVAASNNNGGSIYGGFLMLMYTLGLAIPFLILAVASSFFLRYLPFLKQHMLLIKRIGGGLIVIMGIFVVFGKLNVLSGLFS